MTPDVLLYVGEALGKYGFPNGHPFGTDRQDAFWKETVKQGLDKSAKLAAPRAASRDEIERFHSAHYVERVDGLSELGVGSIDYGDTPAYPGVYDASAAVVGSALEGLERVMSGDIYRTFQPIGGLHHARRDNGAGFCVFNDCGVVIDTLREKYGIRKVAYVDIDVHHGDGLFYPYEHDAEVFVADIHEDGRFLYPGKATPARQAKARPPEPSSTFRCNPAQPIDFSCASGSAWSNLCGASSPNSSCSSAAPTVLPAIRLRICNTRRRPTRMPRGACAGSPMSSRADVSWALAAAAIIGPTSRSRGTRC